ncbi:unnamed protein product [Eruca vesicaria subsp. sativa]|uniref:Uncharacterized protein n=1 Tax=Eruca vesicaria subsp. sativa TaxID=29727 RepID=A0ABC8KU01_ERUVS|nr:unnamed protein product [Eruca vesicaria subsp. sativa]
MYELVLTGCTSLVKLPSSIGSLKLSQLDLTNCSSLVALPPSIGNLTAMHKLLLTGCTSLVKLPSSIGNLKLSQLDLTNCSSLVALPSSIGNLFAMHKLLLTGCTSLVKLPSSIGNLSRLGSLNLSGCTSLVTLPSSIGNLSRLGSLNLSGCTSLVTLPSSIGNLSKLYELDMSKCSNLKFLPADVDLESLKLLNLNGCSKLRTFPCISRNITRLYLEETALEEEDSSWIENIPHLTQLCWEDVPLSCMPSNFNPKDLEYLKLRGGRLKKIWEGVKSLEKLRGMNLSGCESLVEIPDLSMVINLKGLDLKNCKSLVMLPSSVWDLYKLSHLNMEGCTSLEVLLPVDINLVNLFELNLSGCSKLRDFPRISTGIIHLYLDDTAIEEIPSWIKNMSRLRELTMRRCKHLKNISAEIFKFESLSADFSDCGGITTICDHLPRWPHFDIFNFISLFSSFRFPQGASFKFYKFFNLDGDAQEIIIQSHSKMDIIPGGEVPTYFTHRACGSSLSILLPESSLSQESIIVKACIVVGSSRNLLRVRQSFRGQKQEFLYGHKDYSFLYEMDHLVLLNLDLQINRVANSPSELNNNVLLLEFYNRHYDEYVGGCSCGSYGCRKQNPTLEEIKGCGARVMNISETDFRESDEESSRSKKNMRMTVQEDSNSMYIQTEVNSGLVANLDLFMGLVGASGDEESDKESDEESNNSDDTDDSSNISRAFQLFFHPNCSEFLAPNLDLLMGLAGASGEVSSGRKMPSPSRNFCGDASSSFHPCLGGESLHFE